MSRPWILLLLTAFSSRPAFAGDWMEITVGYRPATPGRLFDVAAEVRLRAAETRRTWSNDGQLAVTIGAEQDAVVWKAFSALLARAVVQVWRVDEAATATGVTPPDRRALKDTTGRSVVVHSAMLFDSLDVLDVALGQVAERPMILSNLAADRINASLPREQWTQVAVTVDGKVFHTEYIVPSGATEFVFRDLSEEQASWFDWTP